MMTQASVRSRPVAPAARNTLPPKPRPASGRPLRVVVADAEPPAGSGVYDLLCDLGHEVCLAGTGPQLFELCQRLRPDLVIAAARLPGLLPDVRTAFRDHPIPVIVVHDGDVTAFESTEPARFVCAVLARPVTPAGLTGAIAVAEGVFRQVQALRREVATLRQQLDDRKLIERAKGALVRRVGVAEDDAFRRLRKYASDHNLKVADVARRVLDAEDVFHELDGSGGPS
jgi:AmiR/NasT family two-component response regulator